MAYPLFSQPTGPVVPINLFAENAEAGAKVGNEIPTQTTSIIKGIESGLQAGEGLVQGAQKIEENQNTIDQEPTANAQAAANLQRTQQENEIKGLQADIDTKTHDLQITNTSDQLTAQNQALEQKVADTDAKSSISKLLANPNPSVQSTIFSDPNAVRVLQDDPVYAKSVYGSLAAGAVSPEQLQALYDRADFTASMKANQSNQQANVKALSDQAATADSTISKAFDSPAIQYAGNGITNTSDAIRTMEVHPIGVKTIQQTDPANPNAPRKIVSGVPDGSPASDLQPGAKPYQIFTNGVYKGDISESDAQRVLAAQRALQSRDYIAGLQNGVNANSLGNKSPTQVKQQVSDQSAGTGTFQVQGLGGPVTPPPTGLQSNTNGAVAPGMAPAPAGSLQDAPTNAVVQASRVSFQNLAKQGGGGIQGSTLIQRLQQQKQAIRSQLAATQPTAATNQAVQNGDPELDSLFQGNVGGVPDSGDTEALKNPAVAKEQLSELFSPEHVPPSEGVTLSNEDKNVASVLKAQDTPPPGYKVSAPNSVLSSAMQRPVSLNVQEEFVPKIPDHFRVQNSPYLSDTPVLIKGLASVESKGVTDALSPTGVGGLLEVTKQVAAPMGLNRDIPSENVQAGQNYLYKQLKYFHGDLRLALTAYSAAGPEGVKAAIKKAQSTDWPAVQAALKTTVSADAYKQAKNYADKVISAATTFLPQTNKADALNFLYMLNQNGLIRANDGEA